MMTVVQCWDDGVHNDARVAQICRRHGAAATFNLNAGLHRKGRSAGWTYKGTDVVRLGWDEMRDLYDGFTVANHSLTHPRLEQITVEIARKEIAEGRDRLQQFFEQPVRGFAYPYGTYNVEVMKAVRDAGHCYARTTRNVEQPFPPEDPMAFHPNCHVHSPDFWSLYEKAREGGVFYFWGHSYEICTNDLWEAFERKMERISADPESRWDTVASLFEPPDQQRGR
jgi:peptidoglycan/xylan/chitin deacetylase (PgdA/CDA1 family)